MVGGQWATGLLKGTYDREAISVIKKNRKREKSAKELKQILDRRIGRDARGGKPTKGGWKERTSSRRTKSRKKNKQSWK